MRLALTIIIALCASPVARSAPFGFHDAPFPGLVGWWTFNEGTGTSSLDSSGANNPLALTNTPSWTAGPIASAITLNGSSQLGRSANATRVPPFTVAAWVRFNATNSAQWILTRTDFASNLRSWHFGIASSGTFNFGSSVDGTGGGGSILVNYTWSGTPTNTWTHVCAVYSNAAPDKVTLYVNGTYRTPTKTTDASGTPFSSGLPLMVGAAMSGGSISSPLNGSIDDVRTYNRALTAEEVRSIYNQRSGGQ